MNKHKTSASVLNEAAERCRLFGVDNMQEQFQGGAARMFGCNAVFASARYDVDDPAYKEAMRVFTSVAPAFGGNIGSRFGWWNMHERTRRVQALKEAAVYAAMEGI